MIKSNQNYHAISFSKSQLLILNAHKKTIKKHYSRNTVIAKTSQSCKGSAVKIKGIKPKGK